MHIKQHPHLQSFCGIVVHDRTDVPQKIYSFPSRFKHKNFGLKWQKMRFFELFKLFLGFNAYQTLSPSQTFCGIVVHDRTDVPQKINSFPSRFKHNNFGLKWQKKQFF